MYSIYSDGICIYNDAFPLDNQKLINPKLVLEDNAAGSLSITVPMSNVAYESIHRMSSEITVLKDDNELWSGRVLSETVDFCKNRVLYCEGELAYLNDSIQPPAKYTGQTIRAYLEQLLSIHNAKVSADKRFTVGIVTVHDDDTPDRFTNYEKTIKCLNSLIENYGGHLRIRKEDGVRYLDYLEEYPNECTQTIQFGVNLIEFSKKFDMSEYATAIVPLGERLRESQIEELDAYLTIESVNDGIPYLESSEAVSQYGWIEKTVSWDDISDPAILLEKAQQYLSDTQFENVVLELSALDMHYLNADAEAVKLLDEIRVVSLPHGMDRLFPVKKLEIPLDSPEKTQFKLGDDIKTSLTEVNNKINMAIMAKINAFPKPYVLLEEAKENATAIMTTATTGFITITKDNYGSETLYISNDRDYRRASKLWKWNVNGLGYSNDGGQTYGLAMTMDGVIVADYITSGTLNANIIRAGVIKDVGQNVILDLDQGKLTMKKGSIYLGAYNQNTRHYKFEVDEEGNLYAGSGVFAGSLAGADITGATGTFTGVVHAADFVSSVTGQSMVNSLGQFTADYLDVRGLNVNNKFIVDQNGNVTITGGSISWGAVTGTTEIDNRITAAGNAAATAQNTATAAGNAAASAGQAAGTAYNLADAIAKGTYNGSPNTFIDHRKIYSPEIYSDEFIVTPKTIATNQTGGITLTGLYNGRAMNMLKIYYWGQDIGPITQIEAIGRICWDAERITFDNQYVDFIGATLDFSGASVTGLTARFG